MSKKLYVGNLPYTVTNEELQEAFVPYGTVTSAKVITDRDTGRSKGFGFVEMASEEEAAKAKATLNGGDWGGRALTVDLAVDKPRDNKRGGDRRDDRRRA